MWTCVVPYHSTPCIQSKWVYLLVRILLPLKYSLKEKSNLWCEGNPKETIKWATNCCLYDSLHTSGLKRPSQGGIPRYRVKSYHCSFKRMWGQGLDTIPQSTLLSSLSNQQAKQLLKGQRACGVTCMWGMWGNVHVWKGMEITSSTGLFHYVTLWGLFGGILLDIYGFIVVGWYEGAPQ